MVREVQVADLLRTVRDNGGYGHRIDDDVIARGQYGGDGSTACAGKHQRVRCIRCWEETVVERIDFGICRAIDEIDAIDRDKRIATLDAGNGPGRARLNDRHAPRTGSVTTVSGPLDAVAGHDARLRELLPGGGRIGEAEAIQQVATRRGCLRFQCLEVVAQRQGHAKGIERSHRAGIGRRRGVDARHLVVPQVSGVKMGPNPVLLRG